MYCRVLEWLAEDDTRVITSIDKHNENGILHQAVYIKPLPCVEYFEIMAVERCHGFIFV
jgi:hypothetical protein